MCGSNWFLPHIFVFLPSRIKTLMAVTHVRGAAAAAGPQFWLTSRRGRTKKYVTTDEDRVHMHICTAYTRR